MGLLDGVKKSITEKTESVQKSVENAKETAGTFKKSGIIGVVKSGAEKREERRLAVTEAKEEMIGRIRQSESLGMFAGSIIEENPWAWEFDYDDKIKCEVSVYTDFVRIRKYKPSYRDVYDENGNQKTEYYDEVLNNAAYGFEVSGFASIGPFKAFNGVEFNEYEVCEAYAIALREICRRERPNVGFTEPDRSYDPQTMRVGYTFYIKVEKPQAKSLF